MSFYSGMPQAGFSSAYNKNNEEKVCKVQCTSSLQDCDACNVGEAVRLVEKIFLEKGGREDDHTSKLLTMALALAEAFKLTEEEIHQLHVGVILHDLGKTDIPAVILDKKSHLTPAETRVMQTHPLLALPYLRELGITGLSRDVILAHHEKFDGSGYPFRLSGQDIPFIARIFAAADILDALMSSRPYRDAFSPDQAKRIFSNLRGTHLDPLVVDIGLEVLFPNSPQKTH